MSDDLLPSRGALPFRPAPPMNGAEAVSAVPVGVTNAAWHTTAPYGLEAAIGSFKTYLPGWWFTVGECQVSADASCGPTRESKHLALIPFDRQFDDGFHADIPQPATMADALRDVQRQACDAIAQAIEAQRAETGTGSVHESAVPNGNASNTQGQVASQETEQ